MMEHNNKTYFQRVSATLENLLQQYKSQHPKNYGVLIRDFFPTLLMTLPGLAFFYAFFYSTDSGSITLVFVAFMLFIFGVILRYMTKKEKPTNQGTLLKINTLKQQISGFDAYPDVKQYTEQFDHEVDGVTTRKNQIINNFDIFKIVYFVLGGILSVYWLVAGFSNRDNLTNERTPNLYTEILGLDDNVPFLTLSPLKTDIAPGLEIKTPKAEFYLQGVSENTLIIKQLEITTDDSDQQFRLMITDTDGRPVSQCPKFVFRGGQTDRIESLPICFDQPEKQQNDFQAMQVLQYLHKNKADLRFTVEKIN